MTLQDVYEKFIDNIGSANIANVITIPDRLDTAIDADSLLDFFDKLSEALLITYIVRSDSRLLQLSSLISNMVYKLDFNLDCNYLFVNFLTSAWEIMHVDA